jgi:hypothetical protein
VWEGEAAGRKERQLMAVRENWNGKREGKEKYYSRLPMTRKAHLSFPQRCRTSY